jgi:hypothetical protein
MLDFDPRDSADPRDDGRDGIYDSRWGEDPRDRDERERELDLRDRDPRDPFVRGFTVRHAAGRSRRAGRRDEMAGTRTTTAGASVGQSTSPKPKSKACSLTN